jgi:hypothetical protein
MAPRRTYPKTSGPMDQWLESQGYYRKHTARDGTCLFRAVSEQVWGYTRHLGYLTNAEFANYKLLVIVNKNTSESK